MKVIGFTIAAFAILLTVAAASAQPTVVPCYPLKMTLVTMLKDYGESPVFVFSNNFNETFLVTANPATGSWSSFKQAEGGSLCPVSSGGNFGPVPEAFKAQAIPGEDS